MASTRPPKESPGGSRHDHRRINPNNNIYQFKVILRRIHPKIWRRIQVPGGYNFHDFHLAIQKSMGWHSVVCDYHAHNFKVLNPQTRTRDIIGLGGDAIDSARFSDLRALLNWENDETLDEKKCYICHYFKEPSVDKALYTYDFGDNWIHVLRLEKIFEAEEGVMYPRCVDGQRACPPEDCGGISGYYKLLEILQDPSHGEYQERVNWLKRVNPGFKPEVFDPTIPFNRPFNFVIQFKITLQGSNPLIWRRVQVADSSKLYDLHLAVKKVMEYKEPPQHAFIKLRNIVTNSKLKFKLQPRYQSPELAETYLYINQESMHFYREGWLHKIVMEASFLPVNGVKYPRCVDGHRAAPLEDCGGVYGYNELVEILNDPQHPQYATKLEWVNNNHPNFNPDTFNNEDHFNDGN